MKINELLKPKICPCCGKLYSEPSALSRSDGVTAICPDCDTREALESMGVAAEEQEKILDIIHQTYGAR